MKTKNIILTNTLLAMSTGLYIGGIIAGITTKTLSIEILKKLYMPALFFYFGYVVLHLKLGKKDKYFVAFILVICILIICAYFS